MGLLCLLAANAHSGENPLQLLGEERGSKDIVSHSCIHDQIVEQRRRPGRKVYSVTPQVYHDHPTISEPLHRNGRALLSVSKSPLPQKDAKQPIRIFLNYDAVGHSPDRDCRRIGEIVKVGVANNLAILDIFMGTDLELMSGFFLCLSSFSLGSLHWRLCLELLLAIHMVILQYMVTAGTTALWMIYLGRTKGDVCARWILIAFLL